MSDCVKWEEAISAYLDGELDREETLALRDHVKHCPACAETLRQYRQLFGYQEPTAAPQGFTGSVMGAITLVKAPQRAKTRPPIIRILAVAAACLLIAVTAIPLLHTLGPAGSSGSAAMKSVAAPALTGAAYDTAEVTSEESAEAPEAAFQMMLMSVPSESTETEGAAEAAMDILSDDGVPGEEGVKTASGGASPEAGPANSSREAPAPLCFLVYGPLPEALEALDFEDRGEGMVFEAEIDADTAARLLEEGSLSYEPSEDGLYRVLWYPQG